MKDIKLLSKNKYLKVPLLFTGGGGGSDWRQHLQPCEYLHADNDSYIQFDADLNNITYIKCKANSGIADKFIFQSHGENNAWLDFLSSSNTYAFRPYNRQASLLNFNKGQNITINFDIPNKTLYYSNYTLTFTQTYIINNNYIRLFDDDVYIYFIECNIFNLIPCYVIDEYTDNKGNLCSSGVPGMVDTLTGVFYSNDGNGQFSNGGDIEI